jgi:hypothetical protein
VSQAQDNISKWRAGCYIQVKLEVLVKKITNFTLPPFSLAARLLPRLFSGAF